MTVEAMNHRETKRLGHIEVRYTPDGLEICDIDTLYPDTEVRGARMVIPFSFVREFLLFVQNDSGRGNA